MRTGNDRSTARVARQVIASHANHRTATRREATRSIREQLTAERRVTRIGGDVTADEISREVRVGQFEKFDEGIAFVVWRLCVPILQIPQQQQVQLLHSPAAAPPEAPRFNAAAQASSS